MSTEPSCTVCEQSDSNPTHWGAESAKQLREQGISDAPMGFINCNKCGTLHVCPDCYHEHRCCEAKESA